MTIVDVLSVWPLSVMLSNSTRLKWIVIVSVLDICKKTNFIRMPEVVGISPPTSTCWKQFAINQQYRICHSTCKFLELECCRISHFGDAKVYIRVTCQKTFGQKFLKFRSVCWKNLLTLDMQCILTCDEQWQEYSLRTFAEAISWQKMKFDELKP